MAKKKTKKKTRPSTATMQKILKIKAEIEAKYDELNKIEDRLLGKFGEGEWVVENPNGEGYLKLVLKDQLKAFREGNPIHCSAYAERYVMEVRTLKNKPRSKK